jgi:hypothetical protein
MTTVTCQLITDDDDSIYHLKITAGGLSATIYQFFFEGIPTDTLQKFVETSAAEETQLGDDLSHQVNLVPQDDEVTIESINHGPGSWSTITVPKNALLPVLKDLLSRLDASTSETDTVTDIVQFIREKRESELTDPEIYDMVRAKFSDYCFTFGNCVSIDVQLDSNQRGGYWRTAYGWPKRGDTVNCGGRTATNCGFFTFDMC